MISINIIICTVSRASLTVNTNLRFSGNFLKLNHEILELYSACSTAAEVIEQQNEHMKFIEQESADRKCQDMTEIDLSVEMCNPNRQTVPEYSESSEDYESSEEEEADSEESASESEESVESSAEPDHVTADHVIEKLSSVTFLDQDEVYDI